MKAKSLFYTFRTVFGLAFFALLVLAPGCTFRAINAHRNIIYASANAGHPPLALNVFSPRSAKETWPVLVFIHGGSWRSGNKEMYSFFGRRLARKQIVAVIIDYPLSPAQYPAMATAAAEAVAWTRNNIGHYGGDSTKIFASGHSAGGHLAALIATDTSYFHSLGISNPLKGVILIDAAGLDMYGYLQEKGPANKPRFLDVFTTNPDKWKDATPFYHLYAGMPPFLIFRGGLTYPSIKSSNNRFEPALRAYQPNLVYKVQPLKGHIPMITQFLNGFSPRYRDIRRFVNQK